MLIVNFTEITSYELSLFWPVVLCVCINAVTLDEQIVLTSRMYLVESYHQSLWVIYKS